MDKKNKIKIDRIKEIKRISREENRIFGKGGAHKVKDKYPNKKKRLCDYLSELEDDCEE